MIKLACNYMSEVIELIDENRVDIDFLKYPSLSNDEGFRNKEIFYQRIEDIKKYRSILYHGNFPCNIFIGDKDFKEKFDLDAFRDVCNFANTHGISFHFSGGKAEYSKEETIKIAVSNIEYIKVSFPEMKFITIENSPSAKNQHELDPDVIYQIVEKADIGFLYDISHAYKCSVDQGRKFDEYISRLPLHRLYEMHINGWQEKDDDIQAHMCIQEELYEHIEDVVERYPVKILTLEYGRPNDRIDCGCPIVKIGTINEDAKKEVENQLVRLQEIIKTKF
ncbi:MAG: DUF692 family protein [Clostridiales bacterium]|nr:DUF692 family protein [Clostridiales bacterium]